MDDLGEVAGGDASPLESFEGEEAVRGSLRVADWNGLRRQASTDDGGDEGERA